MHVRGSELRGECPSGSLGYQVSAVAFVGGETAECGVQLGGGWRPRSTDQQLGSDAAGSDAGTAAERPERRAGNLTRVEAHVDLNHGVRLRIVDAADGVGAVETAYVSRILKVVNGRCAVARFIR